MIQDELDIKTKLIHKNKFLYIVLYNSSSKVVENIKIIINKTDYDVLFEGEKIISYIPPGKEQEIRTVALSLGDDTDAFEIYVTLKYGEKSINHRLKLE